MVKEKLFCTVGMCVSGADLVGELVWMGGEEFLCTEGTGVATPGTELVVGSLGLLDREKLVCTKRYDVFDSLSDVSCGALLFRKLAISACTRLLALTFCGSKPHHLES